MRKYIIGISRIFCLIGSVALAHSCDLLMSKEDLNVTEGMMDTRYYQMFDLGYRVYEYVPYGFTKIDGNLFAGVTDEAQYVTTMSATSRFNEGSWSAFYNPDDMYASYYNGIYAAHNYLDKSEDYKEILLRGRDTLSSGGLDNYKRDVLDVERLRAEAHILKAFYYFELAKRYGGVPLIDKLYEDPSEANLPRASFEDIIGLVVREVDDNYEGLVDDWSQAGQAENSGRITRSAAMALKSRALLYAASPLFNQSEDSGKWEDAAFAAYQIIIENRFSLHSDYGALFVGDATNTSPETIWAIRMGLTNEFERSNYPIGTPGGATGICPTQNMVDAYEYLGERTDNPYENKDPRFYASIVYNGSEWNGRTMQIYIGGTDDPSRENASPTGYYLRKFMNENLNLTNDAMEVRSWIVFRYAEILLNFAEAMNEAYGPDDEHGYGMSSRDAINMVRSRQGVSMPEVNVPDGDKIAMREAIKRERMVELAFEDHRYWDLKRWKDAEDVLNKPVYGVEILVDGENLTYNTIEAGSRVFSSKMYLYPIPQTEIVKSSGILEQNQGW